MRSCRVCRKLLVLMTGRKQPERPLDYGSISKELGYPNRRSLPGLLGAYGRRAKHRYNGYWPVQAHWDAEQWSWMMWMRADVAEALREIHAEQDRPTER